MSNKTLSQAKNAKRNEFYTRLEDIEQELTRYDPKLFYGKTVFCNCDDPTSSEFWHYFHMQFSYLRLKALYATHYNSSGKPSYAMKYVAENPKQDIDRTIGTKIPLKGNGDFRSQECIDLLKKSDIVVTNPPFSLFREYVAQLMKYKKHFIIWGNNNAITYKEIFPLIKDNRMWLGYRANKTCYFTIPNSYPKYDVKFTKKMPEGHKYAKVPAISTFTNLDTDKRHEKFDTVYRYREKDKLYPKLYPKYDNYNAIEISKVIQLPMDYKGVMGIPITFLTKYNPEQFKIIGLDRYTVPKKDLIGGRLAINGKAKYARILIKKVN